MKRAYNFNAGPSAMPLEVLLEAQEEFLNYQNTGMSIIDGQVRRNSLASLIRAPHSGVGGLMPSPKKLSVAMVRIIVETSIVP